MQSPRSAGEMQTLPARPVVKNTYGKPKTVVAPIMQADESFTSDLTSLSQLSALPSSSAVCKAQNDAMLPEAGIESDQDEDEAKDIADSGYYPARKSVKEALEDIDAASDAAGEDGDRQFSTLFAQTDVRLVQTTEQPAEQSLDHKRERVVSGASSSSTNDFHRVHNQNLASTSSPQRTDARHSSPPTSPRLHAAEAQHDTDDEEENILVKHSRTALRPARKILDSEDDESDEPSKSNRVSVSARKHSQFKARSRQVIEDEEEEQGQSSESETEDLPSLQHAGKSRKVHVGSQAEDEGDIETQKTEAIEQYEDSQIYQSNRLSESPDVKKKSRKPRVRLL